MRKTLSIAVAVLALGLTPMSVFAETAAKDTSSEEKAWQAKPQQKPAPPRPAGSGTRPSPPENKAAMEAARPAATTIAGDRAVREVRGERPIARAANELLGARRQAERLERSGEEIAKLRERAEAAPDDATRKRLKKMADLREELIPLEKEEFVAQVRERSGKALEQIDEAQTKMDEAAAPRAEVLERLGERVRSIHDAAVDFDTLAAALKEVPEEGLIPAATGMGMGEEFDPSVGRQERMIREMEFLRQRMNRLEQEWGGPPSGMQPPRPPMPPPPPGAPDDRALRPGSQDGPPPARGEARERLRQRQEEERRRSQDAEPMQ